MCTAKGIQIKMNQTAKKNVNILGGKVLYSLNYMKLSKISQILNK